MRRNVHWLFDAIKILAILLSVLSSSHHANSCQLNRDFISLPRVEQALSRVNDHGDSVQRFELARMTITMGGNAPSRSVTTGFGAEAMSILIGELLQQNRIEAAIEVNSWQANAAAKQLNCCFGDSLFLSTGQIREFTKYQTAEGNCPVVISDVVSVSELLFMYQERLKYRTCVSSLPKSTDEYVSSAKRLLATPDFAEYAKVDFVLSLVCAMDMFPSAFSELNVREIHSLLRDSGLGESVYHRCLELGWIRLAGVVSAALGDTNAAQRFEAFLGSQHYLATAAFACGQTNNRFKLLNKAQAAHDVDVVNRLLSRCKADSSFVVSHDDLRTLSGDRARMRMIGAFLEQLRGQVASSQFGRNLEVVRQYRGQVGYGEDNEFVRSDLVDLDLTLCSSLRSLGRWRDARSCFSSIVRDLINSRETGFLESSMTVPQTRPITIRLLESSSIDSESVSALQRFFGSELRDGNSPWRHGAEFLNCVGYTWEAGDRDAQTLDFVRHNREFAPSFCNGVARRLKVSCGINRKLESFVLLDDAGLFDDAWCVIEFLRGLKE